MAAAGPVRRGRIYVGVGFVRRVFRRLCTQSGVDVQHVNKLVVEKGVKFNQQWILVRGTPELMCVVGAQLEMISSRT